MRCRLAYGPADATGKIQIGFTFLAPAHPGSPGKRALKRVCVCVWETVLGILVIVGLVVVAVY